MGKKNTWAIMHGQQKTYKQHSKILYEQKTYMGNHSKILYEQTYMGNHVLLLQLHIWAAENI